VTGLVRDKELTGGREKIVILWAEDEEVIEMARSLGRHVWSEACNEDPDIAAKSKCEVLVSTDWWLMRPKPKTDAEAVRIPWVSVFRRDPMAELVTHLGEEWVRSYCLVEHVTMCCKK
jgi:hypothetical protein